MTTSNIIRVILGLARKQSGSMESAKLLLTKIWIAIFLWPPTIACAGGASHRLYLDDDGSGSNKWVHLIIGLGFLVYAMRKKEANDFKIAMVLGIFFLVVAAW